MVFYKGGVWHKDKYSMPIPEILNLRNDAERINKEIAKEQNKRRK
jgi:hypothetical protein